MAVSAINKDVITFKAMREPKALDAARREAREAP